jgi:hypothetical protein
MGLYDSAKELAGLITKLNDLPLLQKILDLQQAALAADEERTKLKAQIQELEKKLAFQETLEFRSPFYYAEGDDTPYCAHCWESEKKAIHLPPAFNSASGPVWECPSCKQRLIEHDKKPPHDARSLTRRRITF